MDGLLLVGVMGAGHLGVPVDCAVHRPDPAGPCRNKLTWLQVMRDRTWAAVHRRGRRLLPPLVLADRWLGDSRLLAPVANGQHGTLAVAGKTSSVLHLSDGGRLQGSDLLTREAWRWRDSPQLPGGRYARRTATRPTDGPVTLAAILFRLNHDWRFLDTERLDLHGLSWGLLVEAA